jgi:hypothetical protein
MKFLIQKINKEIRHDFSFTLIDMIRFKNWLYENRNGNKIIAKYLNYDPTIQPDPNNYQSVLQSLMIPFKESHKNYVPIGSVEFVTEFLQHFYGLTPKPLNVPEELFRYAEREIFNGNHLIMKGRTGDYFVKSNDKIKSFAEFIEFNSSETFPCDIPVGNYQYSQKIDIQSEWRAFVYEGKLVGLHNYSGDFTLFPNVNIINAMIKVYKSAPIAYTIDIGVGVDKEFPYYIKTFVIECHDFFSCGLYGFNQPILVNMFYKWFREYLKINNK